MQRQSDIKTAKDLEKFIEATPGVLRVTNLDGSPDWDSIFDHLHTNYKRKFVIDEYMRGWYVIPWKVAINHLMKADATGEPMTWAEFWEKYKNDAPIESLFDVQVPVIPGLDLVWSDAITRTLKGILAGVKQTTSKAPKLSIEKLHQFFMMSKAFKTLLNNMGAAPVDFTKK